MFQEKIKNLMEKGDVDQNIVDTIDDLMKERHQQFSEIMKMPIPLVNEIIKRIDKERKAEKKEMDKVRRKK